MKRSRTILKENIKLTIGLPVFNGGKRLTAALNSLVRQNYKDFIIIISDNASTDETEKICRSFQERDNRIKYHRNSKNIGATNNFQKVLSMAKTPFFMWAAHDDVWEPSFISELIPILIENENFILAFCDFDFISDDNEERRYKKNNNSYYLFSKIKDSYTRMIYSIHQNLAMYIYGIYRTKLLKKVGGFSTRSKGGYGDDNLLLMKLTFQGPFYIHPKLLFHKRDRRYKEPTSKLVKIKSSLAMAKEFFKKQNTFQSFSRQLIVKSKINVIKKLNLIYNTLISQIFNYLVILIGSFTLHQSKAQKNLLKFTYKLFLRDRFNRIK